MLEVKKKVGSEKKFGSRKKKIGSEKKSCK